VGFSAQPEIFVDADPENTVRVSDPKKAFFAEKENPAGPIYSQFYKPKPIVELFDMQKDPDQVKNLAGDRALKGKLEKLSAELYAWMIKNRDLGVVPEPMLFEMTGDGRKYATLYEYGQSDDIPIKQLK